MSTTVIKDVTRGLQALLLNQLNPGGTSTAQVSLVPPGETLPKGLGDKSMGSTETGSLH